MTWTCNEFDRWLDDLCPEATRGRAETHAGECDRCSHALLAAHSVETALRLPKPSAPAPLEFTDAVMRRISRAHPVRPPAVPGAAWLLRWLLADATTMLLCVLALSAGLWWQPLWGLTTEMSARLITLLPTPAIDALTRPADLDFFTSPGALAGMAVGMLPLIVWGSWLLMVWSQRVTARAIDGFSARYLDSFPSADHGG